MSCSNFSSCCACISIYQSFHPMEPIQGITIIIIHVFSTLLFFLSLIPLSSSFSTQQTSKLQFKNIEDVVGTSFDYIVVGGGTSGCSLAATLSQNYSVLLVERGGSPYGNPLVEEKVQFGFAGFQTDEFTSVSQQFISEEGVVNQRGRILGGSTAINGGFYSRASKKYIMRARWDPELVREAYEWAESKIVFRPSLTPWQSVSADAMVEAGIRPFNGFSLEHLQGTKVGSSIFDAHGRRHTSADLLAAAGNSNKITLLLNATVQNVIFLDAGTGTQQPRAHGIRFMRSSGKPNKLYEVYLNQPDTDSESWGEVILCAGALGSPQILMLSGIGRKEHLIHFNITPVADVPEVGQSMQDNPAIFLFLTYSSHALQKMPPDPPLVAGIVNGFRIIIETAMVKRGFNTSTQPGLGGKLAYPGSRGSLRLASRDPRQNPSVKFNYLAEEKDLDGCVKMVRLLEKIANSRSISAFLGSRQARLSSSSHLQELKDLCKNKVRTNYHYHGGCIVGSVVDRDYRVFGVEGLRVVDGSTLHDSPGTNPMATLLMLGRYQGIKMLRKSERATRK